MKSKEKIQLDALSAQVQAALKLLDTEAADALIGERTEDYDTLIQGANALMALDWSMKKTQGLRETQQSLKAGAQTMTMVLQLVHFAYALGVKRGKGG